MKPVQKWRLRAAMYICLGCLCALIVLGKARNGFAQVGDPGLSQATRTLTPSTIAPNALTTVDLTLSGNYCSIEADTSATGADIALVIDRSGSMDGAPLELAINASKGFLKRSAASTNRIGIISFSDQTERDTPIGAPIVELATALDALEADGGTSISGGLDEAFSALSASPMTDHAQAMILLSDGYHNEGRPVEEAAAEACAADVQLFTIGLGDGVDPVLQDIPCNGGQYFFAPTPDDLNSIYQLIANEIDGFVARDLVITEQIPNGLTVGYVSDSGVVSENTIQWRIPLMDETERTFTYQVSGENPVDYTFLDSDVQFTSCRSETETRTIPLDMLTIDAAVVGSGREPIVEQVNDAPIDTTDTADFIVLTEDELGCTYDWIDVSASPSRFRLGDDQFRQIDFDYPFQFGDLTTSSIVVSNNGGVSFGPLDTDDYLPWDNESLLSINYPSVFPLWDDWLAGEIIFTYEGKAPNRVLVIEWTERIHYWLRGDSVTFQMLLPENSNEITFQYKKTAYEGKEPWTTPPPNVHHGGSATIGLVPTSGDAMQIAYNQANAVENESAICLIPPSDVQITTGVSVDGTCSEADEIDILIGDEVTWCYQVTNATGKPVMVNGLNDERFGGLIDTMISLESGESAVIMRSALITSTTINNSYWSVSGEDVVLDNIPQGTVQLGNQLWQSSRVNILPPGLSLEATVAFSEDQCGQTDMISVPSGAEIVYCYEVVNTDPNFTFTTHALSDTTFGTLFDDGDQLLRFGETALFTSRQVVDGVGGVNGAYEATWTADDNVSATDTVYVTVSVAQEPLQCGQSVGFEQGVPADWSASGTEFDVNNGTLSGLSTTRLDWVPTVSPSCGVENTAGRGIGMCADSRSVPGGQSFTTTLLSNRINVNNYTYDDDLHSLLSFDMQLRFRLSFDNGTSNNQLSLYATDLFGNRDLLQTWDQMLIGETIATDLSPYIYADSNEIQLEFEYTGDSPGGYVQIDTMGIACRRGTISTDDLSNDIFSWTGVDEPAVPTSIMMQQSEASAHGGMLVLLVGMMLTVTISVKVTQKM